MTKISKKQQTMGAMEKYIRGVRQGDFSIGNPDECLFCQIHLQKKPGEKMPQKDNMCSGCPFASSNGRNGCVSFSLYDGLDESSIRIQEGEFDEIKHDLAGYALELENILKVMRTIPAKRYTRSGWKYFHQLDIF